MPLLDRRRFYLKALQWRVGVSGADYDYVGESSLLRCGWNNDPDPWVQLGIPKGTTNVLQQITTGNKVEGFIEVSDWEAIEELLYKTDVVSGGATETAIEANNTRSVIGYFVIDTANIQILDAGDARTTPTVPFTFTNTVIRDVKIELSEPNSFWTVRFYADSVTGIGV